MPQRSGSVLIFAVSASRICSARYPSGKLTYLRGPSGILVMLAEELKTD